MLVIILFIVVIVVVAVLSLSYLRYVVLVLVLLRIVTLVGPSHPMASLARARTKARPLHRRPLPAGPLHLGHLGVLPPLSHHLNAGRKPLPDIRVHRGSSRST